MLGAASLTFGGIILRIPRLMIHCEGNAWRAHHGDVFTGVAYFGLQDISNKLASGWNDGFGERETPELRYVVQNRIHCFSFPS
jgi:hypothetical protein